MSAAALEAALGDPGCVPIRGRTVPTFCRHLNSPGHRLPGDTDPGGSNPAPAEPQRSRRFFPRAFLSRQEANHQILISSNRCSAPQGNKSDCNIQRDVGTRPRRRLLRRVPGVSCPRVTRCDSPGATAALGEAVPTQRAQGRRSARGSQARLEQQEEQAGRVGAASLHPARRWKIQRSKAKWGTESARQKSLLCSSPPASSHAAFPAARPVLASLGHGMLGALCSWRFPPRGRIPTTLPARFRRRAEAPAELRPLRLLEQGQNPQPAP